MNLLERFIKASERHDEELFLIFKDVIDKVIKEANSKEMNGVLKYNLINHKIEETYAILAQSIGFVEKIDTEYSMSNAIQKCVSNPPVSERLEEKIYNYIKPQEKEAREYFKLVASSVLESNSVEDLKQNYQELENLMQLIDSSIYSDIGLEIPTKQRLKILTKEQSKKENMGISFLDLY